MIPGEAVEAAGDALQQYALNEGRDGAGTWQDAARLALEAAAPHLLAQGWDDGFEAGYDRGEWDAAPIRKEPIRENPYRKVAQ